MVDVLDLQSDGLACVYVLSTEDGTWGTLIRLESGREGVGDLSSLTREAPASSSLL